MTTNNTEGAIPEEFWQSIEPDFKNIQLKFGYFPSTLCIEVASLVYRKLTETKAPEIEPYIYSKHGGVRWYHYLHIHGGVGHGESMGGKYKFVIAYLAPDQAGEIGQISLDRFCIDNNIPWGGGKTIEEAYEDFKKAFEINPIK